MKAKKNPGLAAGVMIETLTGRFDASLGDLENYFKPGAGVV